ncbi:hypothetical protein [Caballeronia sp. GAWG1-1]|uniref:hypothetical protein n=1 Tax=Caballeronia sp. GAWG1-1 TaxID=2921742 RepID=UPI0020295FCE|nr:hypothetical protein [Caballeronia sp. GAWG1-1]
MITARNAARAGVVASSLSLRRTGVVLAGFCCATLAPDAFADGLNFGQIMNSLRGGGANLHVQPLVNAAKGQYEKYEAKAQCDDVKTWLTSGPLPAGGGGMSAAQSPQSDPAVTALIQDARFAPVFGKTYDQIDPKMLTEYTSKILPHCFSTTGPLASIPPDQKAAATRAMTSFRYNSNLRLLAQSRAATGGLTELATEAESLKADETGHARLIEIEASAQKILPQAPRAERDEFAKRMTVVEQRVAIPVEDAQTAQAIDNARGYPGMVELAKLYRMQNRPAFSTALTTSRNAEMAKIGVALNQLGTAQEAVERQSIDALGTGLAGLQQGRTWSADFRRRYDGMERVPSVQETYQYFLSRRAQALESSRGEIEQQIRHARSGEEIAQIKSRYLMDSDANAPAGVAIATAMVAQQEDLRKRSALGDAYEASSGNDSARPVAVADAQPRATSKSSERASHLGGEPTAAEMYDAVNNRAQAIARGISSQNERCQQADRSRLTSGDAMLCLTTMFMGSKSVRGNEPMRIDSFQKLGCAPASGKPGYVCDYSMNISGGPADAMRGMFTTLGSGGGETSEARFLNAGGHWIMQVDDKKE